MEFMGDIHESPDGMNRGALSQPQRLKPVPAILSLSGSLKLTASVNLGAAPAAWVFADRPHRPPDGEAHDIFEGDYPAVDDRQIGGDAAGLDPLAVIAAEACAECIV
jgi:hypothetical protein